MKASALKVHAATKINPKIVEDQAGSSDITQSIAAKVTVSTNRIKPGPPIICIRFCSFGSAVRSCQVTTTFPVAFTATANAARAPRSVGGRAITFIGVLWFIGGALTIPGTHVEIPGFLVITAVLYSLVASGAMVAISRSFVRVSESKNQAEAAYRYAGIAEPSGSVL